MKLFQWIGMCSATILLWPTVIFAISNSDAIKLKEAQSYFESEYQEEDYWRTDELLLTATGSLKPVHLAPSVATVITKEEIKAIGATTLDELLETVPGLHVFPSPIQTMDSMYSIRGIHTSLNPQVLLLINNIPVTYGLTGSRPAQFMMPVAMISSALSSRSPYPPASTTTASTRSGIVEAGLINRR